MGWEQKNRIADLRNGHGPAQPLVQWNPVFGAVGIVDSILPGNQTLPIQVQAGSAPIMVPMVDWADVLVQAGAAVAKAHEDGSAITADEAHQLALVLAVADFQRAAVALAANAKALRDMAPTEALPEAPAWKPKLVDDDPQGD